MESNFILETPSEEVITNTWYNDALDDEDLPLLQSHGLVGNIGDYGLNLD